MERGRAVDLDSRNGDNGARVSPRSPGETLRPERVPPPPPRSRAVRHPVVVFLNFLMTVLVIAVVGLGAAVFIGKDRFERPGPHDQTDTVLIARGSNLNAIADLLYSRGVISSKWLFVFGVRAFGNDDRLRAGEYLIPAHASMRAIMDDFVAGREIEYAITIPEGLTSRQIVERLLQEDALTGAIDEVPPEGMLLPETYKFSRGDTRQNILNRMRRDRDRLVTEIWNRRVEDLPISTSEEMVILASIVEKETAVADERSRVAAVFINRLRQNMRLQSDPTVVYAVYGGAGKPSDVPIRRSDLDAQHPYNTYQNVGLPPGPIANPGRASLEAVVNPSRTRDLYFVADGSGGHVFAETYEEHQRNVARWRQIEADRRNAAEAAASEAAAEAAAAEGGADEADGETPDQP